MLLCLFLDFDTVILVIMVTSIIIQQPRDKIRYVMPSTLLLFQIIIRITIELVIDMRKRKIAYQFNFSLIKKYFRARIESTALNKKDKTQSRREGTFAFDLWQHLRIGDVIIIK